MTHFTVLLILKSLDTIHDLLHPFFKDDVDNSDLDKILVKLEKIESEINEMKNK